VTPGLAELGHLLKQVSNTAQTQDDLSPILKQEH
jgi:hypothetical protein